MKTEHVLRKAIPLLVALLALPCPTPAATTSWTGGSDADWFNGANWDSGVPANGDDAEVGAGAAIVLTNSTADLGSLSVSGGTLTFSNWTTKLTATNVSLSGGTIDLPPAFVDGGVSNRVWLSCSNLFIAAGASIDADAAGFAGGLNKEDGHGPGGGGWGGYSSGGGYGGRGGMSHENYLSTAGLPYGSTSDPEAPGSGGGVGNNASKRAGAGGGAVKIEASGTVTVNGTITADGGDAPTDSSNKYGGGGSGGGISIACREFAGTNGVIRAAGGNRGTAVYDGGGGGGRIAVNYNPSTQSNTVKPTVRFETGPGLNGSTHSTFPQVPQIGTLYFPDNSLLKPDWLPHTGEWTVPGMTSLTVDTLVVSNGWLRFPGNGFTLTVTNDLVVKGAGGILDVGGDAFSTSRFGWSYLGMAFYIGLTSGPVANVGGDMVVTNGGEFRFYSGLDNAATSGWGAVLSVTGELAIANSSTLQAWGHPTNGAAPLIRAGSVRIDSSGHLSADCANDQLMRPKSCENWVTLRKEVPMKGTGRSVTDGEEQMQERAWRFGHATAVLIGGETPGGEVVLGGGLLCRAGGAGTGDGHQQRDHVGGALSERRRGRAGACWPAARPGSGQCGGESQSDRAEAQAPRIRKPADLAAAAAGVFAEGWAGDGAADPFATEPGSTSEAQAAEEPGPAAVL